MMDKFGSIIRVNDVNEALPICLDALRNHNVERDITDDGYTMPTIQAVGPVTLVYSAPRRRMLFDSIHDSNPFISLFDSLRWLRQFNPERIVKNMGNNGCVAKSKDGIVIFDSTQGVLDFTVCIPCNEFIETCAADAVCLSMLQELVAAEASLQVGHLVQHINRFYVHADGHFWKQYLEGEYEHGQTHNPYSLGDVKPSPLLASGETPEEFIHDCLNFDEHGFVPECSFFCNVVAPAWTTFRLYNAGGRLTVLDCVKDIKAPDWRLAMVVWLERKLDESTS